MKRQILKNMLIYSLLSSEKGWKKCKPWFVKKCITKYKEENAKYYSYQTWQGRVHNTGGQEYAP